jgi:hypothetical protein
MTTLPAPILLGIDLGKTADYTALVLAEPNDDPRPMYDLTHIERVPLKTRYTDVAIHVREMVTHLRTPAKPGGAPPSVIAVLDFTGVGIAVAEIFLAAKIGCPIALVTITGGAKVTRDEVGIHIPKGELVGVVQRCLQEERLRVPADDPSSDLLLTELADFHAVIRPSGHIAYEAALDWRSGKHDDLVLATALALWWGENAPRPEVW